MGALGVEDWVWSVAALLGGAAIAVVIGGIFKVLKIRRQKAYQERLESEAGKGQDRQ
jgi:hypothetical protein